MRWHYSDPVLKRALELTIEARSLLRWSRQLRYEHEKVRAEMNRLCPEGTGAMPETSAAQNEPAICVKNPLDVSASIVKPFCVTQRT